MTEITIAFGTETGNSEELAGRAAKTLQSMGYQTTVVDLENFTLETLAQLKLLLLITSTYGEGEPPANAEGFYEDLMSDSLNLSQLKFSVCALGDSDYELFCQCGKDFDARLAELGATRLAPRVDCDADYDEYDDWWDGVLVGLQSSGGAVVADTPVMNSRSTPQTASASSALPHPPAPPQAPIRTGESALNSDLVAPQTQSSISPKVHAAVHSDTVRADLSELKAGKRSAPSAEKRSALGSKQRPLFAEITENYNLNSPESQKETRHVSFSLEGSESEYQVGDALGVYPRNESDTINELLHYLQIHRDEWVEIKGEYYNLFHVLKYKKDIVKIDSRIFEYVQPNRAPSQIQEVLRDRKAARTYANDYHLIDLVRLGCLKLTATQLIESLRELAPRLYSISSSPVAHPGSVHLTVDVLRYDLHGEERRGIASNFLGDAEVGGRVAVYVHPTKDFKLCAPEKPIIMIGPGTGVAPFKAMLEEREATRAPGQSWLFFGAQRSQHDFLYKELLEGWVARGVLSQLNCAWSRDQAQKVYVQDLMYKHRLGIWRWLEAGAYIYICGDAKRMAKDVNNTLSRIISEQGQMSADDAESYISRLKRDKRYLRDVY